MRKFLNINWLRDGSRGERRIERTSFGEAGELPHTKANENRSARERNREREDQFEALWHGAVGREM